MTASAAPAWDRLDRIAVAAFAMAAVVSRALARSSAFHSMDAGLLAVATQRYDFGDFMPHPPHYPLAVAAARLLAPATGPFAAYTWLAVLASGVLVAATYALTRRMAGRPTASLAAAALLLSPLALHNGAVPLTYALEGAASAALALVAWDSRHAPSHASSLRRAAAVGVAASIAVGLRPSSALLIAPIAAWAAWGDVRRFAAMAGAAAAATAAWLLPAVAAGGGWPSFLFGVSFQSREFVLANPVWEGGVGAAADHAAWLAYHARAELPFLAAAGLAALAAAAARGRRTAWPRDAGAFLLAWSMPALAFYVLVYAGWPVHPDGYLMGLAPAFAVAAALGLRAAWAGCREPAAARAVRRVGVVLVALAAALPVTWVSAWDDAMRPAREAAAWEDSWDGLEDAFPSNDTALLTAYATSWLRLEHPDHLVWSVEVYAQDGLLHTQVGTNRGLAASPGYLDGIRDGTDDAPTPVPPWVRRIALVDGHPREPAVALLADGVPVQEHVLPSGRRVVWLEAEGITHVEDVLAFLQAPPVPAETESRPPR